jgi:colanic acid/amylovoran biosynthesis protein
MMVFDMRKILITNTTISWNKGSAAQVVSVISSLKSFFPEIEFTLLSYCPELDSSYCSRYDINLVGFSNKKHQKFRALLLVYSFGLILTVLRSFIYSFLHTIRLNRNNLTVNDKHVRIYAEADLILDLSGDSFSDWKNRSIMNVLALLPAILLRKQYVFFSQSIGPFNFWSLPFARFCLEKSDLIVIREEITKRYLECIGIKNRHLSLAADCAFLLEPAPSSRVLKILKTYNISEQDRPLVGISVSGFMLDQFFKGSNTHYLSIIAAIADYIVESKKAQVVLIPHSVAPSNWGNDDVNAIKSVYKLIKNKKKVKLIDNDYDPTELKGIIRCCDFFVGCRMHANIAAISQNIPTIALGWSGKYYGIMERVGMEDYVCNLANLSFEELKNKIDTLFLMRQQIQKKLAIKTKSERTSALSAIKKIVCLLSSNQKD